MIAVVSLNMQHRSRFPARLTRLARKARKALGNAVCLLQELLTPSASTEAVGLGSGLYCDAEYASGVDIPASMRGKIEDACRGRRWTGVQVGDCAFIT